MTGHAGTYYGLSGHPSKMPLRGDYKFVLFVSVRIIYPTVSWHGWGVDLEDSRRVLSRPIATKSEASVPGLTGLIESSPIHQ